MYLNKSAWCILNTFFTSKWMVLFYVILFHENFHYIYPFMLHNYNFLHFVFCQVTELLSIAFVVFNNLFLKLKKKKGFVCRRVSDRSMTQNKASLDTSTPTTNTLIHPCPVGDEETEVYGEKGHTWHWPWRQKEKICSWVLPLFISLSCTALNAPCIVVFLNV